MVRGIDRLVVARYRSMPRNAQATKFAQAGSLSSKKFPGVSGEGTAVPVVLSPF